ncbi:TPA: hypothetical protein NOE63_006647 [Pseudomonas aeruginosa]|uniref:hypothetical protein n=1 Tax=Pseudomonas aeruginosa TaxID=287 RepID=UPI0018CB8B80|nr:hypothetical protein [Pseudomonas aeruginosa]MBM2511498.1 hypothetical protein [Pseudomonas aeruginosa]MBM2574430.1 hypothetical protein [Pseudomonas aeruginosa]MBY9229140.1 hypothetical protein [Pseudomonas aeruginosa]MBY9273728.1 hypothetical protein [Pseudomonas aeruginosa]MBY9553371.1 hypothetical protein [Pseudomonas aeruginosa]
MEREEPSFNEWLDTPEREEHLRDIYFDDQLGPGSEFYKWAESIYRIRKATADQTRCPRRWPYV